MRGDVYLKQAKILCRPLYWLSIATKLRYTALTARYSNSTLTFFGKGLANELLDVLLCLVCPLTLKIGL